MDVNPRLFARKEEQSKLAVADDGWCQVRTVADGGWLLAALTAGWSGNSADTGEGSFGDRLEELIARQSLGRGFLIEAPA